MGAVKELLVTVDLPERERHNSRLFSDLCENVHIHYREYRNIFSLPEYFEFIDIIKKGEQDIRNYLSNNPSYGEGQYQNTIIIAGGRERQMKFLQNSPAPNQSTYDNLVFRIELNEEKVTDEIHIHYRDFRIAMNRLCFHAVATATAEAHERLKEIEAQGGYQRKPHLDRHITDDWSQTAEISKSDTNLMGAELIHVSRIASKHFDDLTTWQADRPSIDRLKKAISDGERLTPILVTKEEDGFFYIIDGHHRARALMESGKNKILAVKTDLSWEQSEPLRHVERILKKFDKETHYRYGFSNFVQQFLALKTNSYYKDHYAKFFSLRHKLKLWRKSAKRRVNKTLSGIFLRS